MILYTDLPIITVDFNLKTIFWFTSKTVEENM
ncbi:hypothetical protein SAMN05444396_105255 [Flavobacterium segetis]|uniref:Uncharacterized protein n=1 Tax=Flavobacterium segetis TaxID=271157 RepID=A0A1M5HQS0_9FLAO|nr:hypothetical protein SAMN05444396_105255 [Flavobacterium segetis]